MSQDVKEWQKILETGREKIDRDMAFLKGCLVEVLDSLGESESVVAINNISGTGSLSERVPQALSIVFQLLNLVEENAAQQAVRARETRIGLQMESGLWPRSLKELADNHFSGPEILQSIRAQTIVPVLTSHPTEAKRWTVLDQHRELYVLLVKLENTMYTSSERDGLRDKIQSVLERLWRTGEILLRKPDIRSERANALYYLKEKFPDVLNRLDNRFSLAWSEAGYARKYPLSLDDYPMLRFGSWVGGDRDGHPLVTAKVTEETLVELRQSACEVIDQHLGDLESRLGLSIYAQKVPDILQNRIHELRHRASPETVQQLQSHEEEPWRQLVTLIRSKLPLSRGMGPDPYQFPSQCLSDLEILDQSLKSVGADRIARREVFPVQRIARVFGFHLAELDVRQNSAFHERALSQLMDAAGLNGEQFLQADEEGRLKILEEELRTLRPFLQDHRNLPHEARSLVDAHTVLRRHIRNYGRAGIGSLIVSMTRSLSDLLCVYVLAREAGLLVPGPGGAVCLVPVVPLFETIDDLEGSSTIMGQFLRHPITRRSLPYHAREWDESLANGLPPLEGKPIEPVQQVMLGYSDSNKDSGILASQWALQKAQFDLLALAEAQGVRILFFHGRGGTISRGAGPTHRFLEALPEGSLRTGLRVTEQGETVAQKYTNLQTAAYNLELLIAGTITTALHKPQPHLPKPLRKAVAVLAETSRRHYQAFLQDPNFIPFYRQATPIDALEASRIGSRPSRRTGTQSLDDLRAIPWVFSWTQARYYFPGWFGVGTALASARLNNPEAYECLHDFADTDPLLRYVLLNVETGLASANPHWMQAYANLVKEDTIRVSLLNRVLEEYERTRTEVTRLMGSEVDLRRPRLRKTLEDRETYLNRLHAEQIRQLDAWRSARSPEEADKRLPSLLLTINAIASGLRTTG